MSVFKLEFRPFFTVFSEILHWGLAVKPELVD